MTADAATANAVNRPLHPALKNVLVFMVGALFGAVCSFIFVTLHPALPPPPQVCPQVSTAAAALGSGAEPTRPAKPPTSSYSTPVVNPSPVVNASQPLTAAPSPESTAAQSPTPAIASNPSPAPTSIPTERPSSTLLIPVAGIQASQLVDTYTQARSGGRVHDAIDIMAPRGTQVIAADDGKVAKLFYSKQGGLTVYQFDPAEKFVYYYAHLDSYAPGLVEGKQLHRGDPVGLVGFSGNASETAPHLHFAISVLGPEKHWWQATAINPYPLLSGR